MREEFEKLVAAGKISRHHVEPLVQLAECGYCMHRSWGFGKITAMDTVFSRFVIDFANKPNHSMDLAFAAESLKPISPNHILVRKANDLQGLHQMAARQHLELIKLVLESCGGKATLDQIQKILVPDVITEDWRKWWEDAKHELKKDGHFQVPSKRSDPVVYQSQVISLQTRLLSGFHAAKGLKARLTHAQEILRNMQDLEDPKTAATEMLNIINVEIANYLRNQPAVSVEATFVRDEIAKAAGLAPRPGETTIYELWRQIPQPVLLIDQMPAVKHKFALQSFRESYPDKWEDVLLASLNGVSAKLCSEITTLLIQVGKQPELKELLSRLINQHLANSELMLWLAKERSDTFADILGPEVFRSMLDAMERDQFSEKKSNRLRDFIMNDQRLLVELIESADIEVIKDLTRALQLSPSFDDMDKRSLLARIVKHFPAIQPLISGDQHTKQETTLQVSWDSLERRKTEYVELVHKKIPANSKEIAIARSYGDLSENHEYKAAKEMQKLLMRRKAELEIQLDRARGTDFSNVNADAVNIGTRVTILELSSQHRETLTILGAWDFDVDKGIVSYLSPLAQVLLNHKVNDEVDFDADGRTKRYRIESIEAYVSTPPSASASLTAPATSSTSQAPAPKTTPTNTDTGLT